MDQWVCPMNAAEQVQSEKHDHKKLLNHLQNQKKKK